MRPWTCCPLPPLPRLSTADPSRPSLCSDAQVFQEAAQLPGRWLGNRQGRRRVGGRPWWRQELGLGVGARRQVCGAGTPAGGWGWWTPLCVPLAGGSATQHVDLEVPSARQVRWPGLSVLRALDGSQAPAVSPTSPPGTCCVASCRSLNLSGPTILTTQRGANGSGGAEEEWAGPQSTLFPPQECPRRPATRHPLPKIKAQHGSRGVSI